MVLVMDTSSVVAAVAVIEGDRVAAETTYPSGREAELREQVRRLIEPRAVTAVVVATGPGSFTGLRVGAAYASGMALGLGVPLLGLASLAIQSERARGRALGVSEAGRGRVYIGRDASAARLVEASDAPAEDLAGWLRPETAARLPGRLLPDAELESFGAAAVRLLDRAVEFGYGRVSLDYMQSFGSLE